MNKREMCGLDNPFGKRSELLDHEKEVVLWNPAFYN